METAIFSNTRTILQENAAEKLEQILCDDALSDQLLTSGGDLAVSTLVSSGGQAFMSTELSPLTGISRQAEVKWISGRFSLFFSNSERDNTFASPK